MRMRIQTPTGRRQAVKPTAHPWPPAEYQLPDIGTLEALSQPGGVKRQTSLFPVAVRDQTKVAQIARLTEIPGVARADTLPPPIVGSPWEYRVA